MAERGFARMTIEAVAEAAGVGKPAIYRRYSDKAALVADVISRQLPVLEPPDLGDSRAELWRAMEQVLAHLRRWKRPIWTVNPEQLIAFGAAESRPMKSRVGPR